MESLCRNAWSTLLKGEKKSEMCFFPLFLFFIYISPHFKMKTHYAAMHFWHLAQDFYCAEKCCYCKSGSLCVILTPLSLLILEELQMTLQIHTQSHFWKRWRWVCVLVCVCAQYSRHAEMCSHRKLIFVLVFSKYLILGVKYILSVFAPTCLVFPASNSSPSFYGVFFLSSPGKWQHWLESKKKYNNYLHNKRHLVIQIMTLLSKKHNCKLSDDFLSL